MGTGANSSPFLWNQEKLDMKKTLKTIASVVCFASIILAGAENLDGSPDVTWTLSWLAVAVVSGLAFNRLDKGNTKSIQP